MKSRKQCKKCLYINDCETINEWRDLVKKKKLKRVIYNHRVTSWETNKKEHINCPDYKFEEK